MNRIIEEPDWPAVGRKILPSFTPFVNSTVEEAIKNKPLLGMRFRESKKAD